MNKRHRPKPKLDPAKWAVAVFAIRRARREVAPLDPYFEWDNSKAAEAYRILQARQREKIA